MTELLDDLRLTVVEPPEFSWIGEPDLLLANLNSQADLDAVDAWKNH